MRTITSLKKDIAALVTELGDLRALISNENRDPDENERKVANAKLSEIDEMESLLDLEQRSVDTINRVKETKEPEQKPEMADEKRSQEKRDAFASPGEFLQAVVRAGSPGSNTDQRLLTRAVSGMSEGVPADGGFLVETQMAKGIMENVWSAGLLLPSVSKISLSGNKNSLTLNGIDETSRAEGSRMGGIRVYFAAEAGQYTASRPKFRQINLKLNKMIGLCYLTDEVIEDANALEQIVTKGFTEEFDYKLTDMILAGSGVGQPLGIMNSGAVVTVAKVSGQAADTIVFDNIVDMWSRLIASSRANSVWLINQDAERQLFKMGLEVGTAGGSAVYLPSGGLSAKPYGTLMGRPVVAIEQAQTLGDKGDLCLVDLSKYVMIDKGSVTKQVSIHVRFDYGEQVMRMQYRIDGRPMLAMPITPANSTETVSPFVTLAERT